MSALLGGCAPVVSGAMNAGVDEASLPARTAEYFGTSPGRVRVSEVNRGLLATSYKARVNGALYNCRVYYGSVDCMRPGAGSF